MYVKVRIYIYMHAYVRWFHCISSSGCATCFSYQIPGSCCDGVLLSCCVLFSTRYVWSQRFLQHHGRCLRSAPPRVEVVSGLVRQDNFVPSRRFREGGLEDLKLSTGGGRQSKYSCWRPRRGKTNDTKPNNSDSLQVHVKPVVSTP